jgi:hypothetical protein
MDYIKIVILTISFFVTGMGLLIGELARARTGTGANWYGVIFTTANI